VVFVSWESALILVLHVYEYVMWAITLVQVALSSVGSLISVCGIVDSCGEIIMCVVYVVSCVGTSLLPATGY
jgi:hypothetical protein